MTAKEPIESRLEKLGRAIGSDESLVQNVMSRVGSIEVNQKKFAEFKSSSLLRRFIMNRFTKLAAAAAIIIAAAITVKIIESSATPAYAIEQTIEAHHSVQYLHVRGYGAEHSGEPNEFWVECDEAGRVKNVRLYFPETEDGPKVVVWNQGKAQVWFKKKNSFITVPDEKVSKGMLKMVQECDPRLAVERLYEQEKQNKVKLDINEPSDKTKDIKVTADFPVEGLSPGQRKILFIDQATKLVTAIEIYMLKDGDYQYCGTLEFFDYNQPIEPEMFTLDKEVPADVMRIDQTTQEVGLAQGNLSNDEVAVEVAKQFFEALIAKDYAKAGKLLEGTPADRMEQMFGRIKFLRIVSIGKPVPHPIPETKGVVVPCVVEIEVDGKIGQQRFDRLGVRQVYSQPGRWTIFGGI